MERERVILTRGLPKTGMTEVEETGDDGDIQAGWWQGLTFASNKERFKSLTLSGDAVIIDRATGLMWPKSGESAGCKGGATDTWQNAVSYCQSLDFAGFTDWRLANIMELFSIGYFAGSSPKVYSPTFLLWSAGSYWSSTRYQDVPLLLYSWSTVDLTVDTEAAIMSRFLAAVRGGV